MLQAQGVERPVAACGGLWQPSPVPTMKQCWGESMTWHCKRRVFEYSGFLILRSTLFWLAPPSDLSSFGAKGYIGEKKGIYIYIYTKSNLFDEYLPLTSMYVPAVAFFLPKSHLFDEYLPLTSMYVPAGAFFSAEKSLFCEYLPLTRS